MTIRPYRKEDSLALFAMFKRSKLEYSFPDLSGPLMESVLVITDEQDRPIAGVAAERICQLYLWMDESQHPAAKLRWIRELHEAMAKALKCKGYSEANCFVPPKLEKSFGRRLMKNFGWVSNWPSFARHF